MIRLNQQPTALHLFMVPSWEIEAVKRKWPGNDTQQRRGWYVCQIALWSRPSQRCASWDCCEIGLQKSKGEFIEGLKDMVCNLLRKYNHQRGAASTGKPPGIIIYRSFVDEDDCQTFTSTTLQDRVNCTQVLNSMFFV